MWGRLQPAAGFARPASRYSTMGIPMLIEPARLAPGFGDIDRDSLEFVDIAPDTIIALVLPERPTRLPQQFVAFSRRGAFQPAQQDGHLDLRSDQQVNMIGHH